MSMADGDTPGAMQYYVDRDLLDVCDFLLGGDSAAADRDTPRHLAICRAVRLAAHAKAIPSVPQSETAVGYRVADHAGETVYESLELEDARMYAQDNEGVCGQDVSVVFADGSVRLGQELSLRPWIKDKAR